jgi:Protein of unknown function (DUF3618)
MSTRTADLGAQIAQHRDKLTETVGALTDKIDTQELVGTLKDHAATSADDLRETAGDARGRKGLIIGAIAAFVGLVLLRRLLG